MRSRRTENNPHGLLLFDSHCHLTDAKFSDDLKEVVKRAQRSGVKEILVPGQNLPDSREAINLCREFDAVHCAVGVHPHEADNFRSFDAIALRELCIEPGIKAIGEIGLDFFRTISAKSSQEIAFTVQIDLARSMDLPMIIHIRDAASRARQILEEQNYFTGVLHCFSGDAKMAEWAVEKGFYISFAGNLTYPETRLAAVAKTVPLERLMVETDSPYMTPEPHRRERNEPALVGLTVAHLAGIFGMTPKEMSKLTYENARRCFRISD